MKNIKTISIRLMIAGMLFSSAVSASATELRCEFRKAGTDANGAVLAPITVT